MLDAQGYDYKVVNQGTSGATTKDALAALPFVLRLHPAVVIVEFGGNDGLRGLPVEQTRSNLDQVLTGLAKAHVKILLAGITLPPDYGPDYIRSFDQIFRDLAAKHHVALVPMLYKNLVNVPGNHPEPMASIPPRKARRSSPDTLLPCSRCSKAVMLRKDRSVIRRQALEHDHQLKQEEPGSLPAAHSR